MRIRNLTICIAMTMILSMSIAGATTLNTKIEFELSAFTGISQLINTDGRSVNVTIHNATGETIVTRNAAAGTYLPNMTITMLGEKFNLEYGIGYIYNLTTNYGSFYYNFTTPAAPPAGGGMELHTGQNTSYRTGDDTDLDGTAKSFTDNGDGTVTDEHTGLMWQKADIGTATNWNNAIDTCNALTTGSYTDWRLPTAYEIITIGDYSCSAAGGHCFASMRNSAFSYTSSDGDGWFWASSVVPTYPTYANLYAAGTGGLGMQPRTNTAYGGNNIYSRCVRTA